MRHVRILSLFISSILPPQPVRKSITNCVACGRFQMSSPTMTPFSSSAFSRRHLTSSSKYANLHPNARPAEPSIAITKLASQGRPNEALAVYLQLIQDGGFPSRESLYQLTRALYKSSNLQGMYAIHDTLISYYSVHPPSNKSARSMTYMYTMLISLIARHKPVNFDTIRALCKEMSQFTATSNIVLYNTLIKTLLDNNQVTQAHALFKDLLCNTTLNPTISTYTILMKDALKRRDYDRILDYLQDIQSKEIIMNYAVVSIVTDALCDIEEFDKAIHVVNAIHHPRKKDELSSPRYRLQLLKSIEARQAMAQLKKKKRKKEGRS
ncbi:hypothetical protein V8B55DRAFT_1476190 [Mucor lusitanicus]|uniref:Pentacotripeptide-repeat region of PRORP domain-containing protein n=1 Tax=Mucor circinelloides f. lusitanicus TaxID=29924 RepID=A0A8H4BGX6_MUCCL|nr:hypothetical protein FB192DRAFT_1375801 [Mucor lusitanicus]